ncbi:hypothetical protein GGR54DRAFT_594836 [Hypoxylon sp. NC1633]|nr:hypothetical protein GGR54DRAFT_594836 [Hypoxylon sp. NC1633]
MEIMQPLFAVAWLGLGAFAYPSDVSLVPRGDPWHDHMGRLGYPQNPDVCKMIGNNDPNIWTTSMASDYWSMWMADNNNDLTDWLQRMHRNATAWTNLTPGVLDCTVLHTENCQPPRDGDCQLYDPAAFHVIQTQAVNLYSLLESLDIETIKQTLITDLQIGQMIRDFIPESQLAGFKRKLTIIALFCWLAAGLVGALTLLGAAGMAFMSEAIVGGLTQWVTTTTALTTALSTTGAIISLRYTWMTDGAIDPGKMEASLEDNLSHYFQDMSDHTASMTAKIFGGKPKTDAAIMDLVAGIDSWYEPYRGVPDSTALLYLFQDDWFITQQSASDVLIPLFQNAFKLMKLGLIGYLFLARGFYVMHYTALDEKTCQDKHEGASRFVDGGCFVLKISGKTLGHDDNAPSELNLAESKYSMALDTFFRNVRDCNNNADAKAYSLDNFDDIGNCFYPQNYLFTDTLDHLWMVNHTIADQLKLKYPKTGTDDPVPGTGGSRTIQT